MIAFRWGRSIRSKLLAGTLLIAAAMFGVFALLNLCCLDRYYRYEKQAMLIQVYQQVNATYQGDPQQIEDALSQLEYQRGISMTILHREGEEVQVKYNTMFRGEMPPPDKQFPKMAEGLEKDPFQYDEEELAEKGYTFASLEDPHRAASFLSLVGYLQGDDILMIGIPLANLEETVQISQTFLLLAGLAALAVGLMLALAITRHFCNPLIQMKDIASSMATLDFSRKYQGNQEDEVGQLGRSLNQLSDYLEDAFRELKGVNLRLEEEIERCRRVDDMRREFIINISHELKTPIALVQGYAEGLRVNLNSNEEDKNYYCDIIMEEAARMNRMVMQLLDLSRIELGNTPPELTEVDIGEMVQQALGETRVLAEEKQLQVDSAGLQGVLWADYDMMEQVVYNYLTNAIHHTPQGGRIRLWSQQEEGEIRVHVWNQGENIPLEEMDKIWEKFYRIDKARSRSMGGTGIGLSIVRAILQAHGGSCGVDNTEDGVDFWFQTRAYQPGLPEETLS